MHTKFSQYLDYTTKRFYIIVVLWYFNPFISITQEVVLDPTIESFETSSINGVEILGKSYAQFQQANQANSGNGLFSIPINTYLDSRVHGKLLFANGRKVIVLKLKINESKGIVPIFNNITLGEGAILTLYDPSKKLIVGGFTASHIKHKSFMPGIIQGDEIIIHYSEPATNKGIGSFTIERIDQIFDNSALGNATYSMPSQTLEKREFGFNSSLFCHKNVNCAIGEPYRNVQRSVMRIIEVFDEGMGLCTGALINNTKNDGTPYVLSAFHCQDGLTPIYNLWRFDFNYEGEACFNPGSEPVPKPIFGAILKSGDQPTDFLLVEMASKVPPSYQAFYSGWDRRNFPTPKTTAMIHHPFGDIKKISIDRQQPFIYADTIKWVGFLPTPPFTHYSTDWDEGTMQPGSSGAPLFNDYNKIIGQLHGGGADCAFSFRSFFGIFNISWNGRGTNATSLKNWLDPMNLGIDTLNGIENPNTVSFVKIRLRIVTADSVGIPNLLAGTGSSFGIKVKYEGNGYYLLDSIPLSTSFNIVPMRDTSFKNGININDVIKLQKHILGIEILDNPYKLVAGDITNDQRLSVLDLVEMKKLLLDKITFFVNNASWKFDPPLIRINNIFRDLSNIQFIGTKIGDVDFTRDVER